MCVHEIEVISDELPNEYSATPLLRFASPHFDDNYAAKRSGCIFKRKKRRGFQFSAEEPNRQIPYVITMAESMAAKNWNKSKCKTTFFANVWLVFVGLPTKSCRKVLLLLFNLLTLCSCVSLCVFAAKALFTIHILNRAINFNISQLSCRYFFSRRIPVCFMDF